jgi:hypothetical protein
MTRAGFPHSDILGSRFVCQLPEAYRRLQRPSSAPSAKASTLCPYKLDHNNSFKKDARVHCAVLKLRPGNCHPHPSAYPPPGPRYRDHATSGSTERYQPAATRATPPPTGSNATRSDPERTTFRLFPQDPTACPANPSPATIRSHPEPPKGGPAY